MRHRGADRHPVLVAGRLEVDGSGATSKPGLPVRWRGRTAVCEVASEAMAEELIRAFRVDDTLERGGWRLVERGWRGNRFVLRYEQPAVLRPLPSQKMTPPDWEEEMYGSPSVERP